jgi:ABC-type transport system involved in cytochrome bd biosynthesis fused ATPase/permease subunit
MRLLGGRWRLWDLEFFHLLVVAISLLIALMASVLVVAMTRTDGSVHVSVTFVACLVALLVVVRAAARAGLRSTERRTAATAALHAREVLLDALALGAPARAGAATSLLDRGADEIGALFARAEPARTVAVLAPAGTLLLLFFVDGWSALVAAGVAALAPIVLVRLGRQAAEEAQVGLSRLRSLASRALELLDGAVELRALGAIPRGRAELEAATERAVASTGRSLRIGVRSATALDVLAGAAVGLVSMMNGLRLLDGSMTLGRALAAALVTVEVFAPLRVAGAAFHAGADGRAALDALDAVVAGARRVTAVPRAALPRAAAAPAIVAFRGASLAPAAGAAACVVGLDAVVAAGAHLVVTGPSGCGKTTLLRAVAGQGHVTRGSLRVGNADAAALSVRQRAATIAMVDQRPFVVDGSLRDNLVLGLAPQTDEELEGALDACELTALLARSHLGLDQPVGEAGRLLSAGERTRLVLARAVVRAPGVLLLDEVGAHLDDGTLDALRDRLASFLAARTVIEAAHGRPLLDAAPRLELGVHRLVAAP